MTTRRQFLVGLAALHWSLYTIAQQSKIPRIGFLGIANPEPYLGFFRERLRELGYIEGQNIQVEIRKATGQEGSILALAQNLVGLKVDIIVAMFSQAAQAAKQATNTIPIVMLAAGDPVGTGLVASLAKPGGNVTGVSGLGAELAAKMLELIREIRPTSRSVGVLANQTDPFSKPFIKYIQSAAQSLKMEIRVALVSGPEQFEGTFADWSNAHVDAVIVQPSLPRDRAIGLSLKHKFISVSPNIPFAEGGGLVGYASLPRYSAQNAAEYVDKILKGAKPADLPVEQPTKFELVINARTAKALGVAIPQSLLIRADRLIE